MKKKLALLMMAGILTLPVTVHASGYVDEMTETFKKYPIEDTEITVNLKTMSVTASGEETTLKESLDITGQEEKAMLKSESALNKGMEEEGYEKEEKKNNVVTYRSKFETRRLFIIGKQPEDDHNAVKVIEKKGYFTIYQYATVTDASNAYDSLTEEGYDVVIDEVIRKDALDSITGKEGHFDSGVSLMGLDKMQDNKYYQKNSVNVAVIDTGIRTNVVGTDKVTVTKDFTEDNDVTNCDIHGTRVGGIIADSTPANVKLWSLKIMTKSGDSSFAIIDTAFTYAYENGADVINMSIGADVESSTKKVTVLKKSIDTCISMGTPVIVSAGNEGHSTNYNYPASYTPVWCISAIDKEKEFASFSNYGEIDFCAIGDDIDTVDGGYDSGTSFSAPYISALAANLKGGMTFSTVDNEYEYIKGMCEDLGDTGYDQYYGYGFPVYNEDYDCTVNGHSWYQESHRDATCLLPETTKYICRYCKEERTEQTGVSLGHDFKEESRTAGTCVDKGMITSRCTRCAVLHKEYTTTDPSNHVHVTTSGWAATCSSVGYEEVFCTDCNKTIKAGSLPKLSHTYVAERKEPTATQNGYIKRVCSVCGDTQITVLPKTSSTTTETGSGSTKSSSQTGGTTTSTTTESKTSSQSQGSDDTEVVITEDKGTSSTYRLPDVKIVKLKNIKGKKVVVSTNYSHAMQIQVSTSKKMKNPKKYTTSSKSYTIKKLKKGKTYYIRVRATSYKNGKQVYGKWSAKKKIKVKK